MDKSDALLTPDQLRNSLALCAQQLLNQQKPEGNFGYEYNWKTSQYTEGDNAVRQAATVWGLALLYQHQPEPRVLTAFRRALAFYDEHAELTAAGGRYVRYPGLQHGFTGAVALLALALVDMLRSPDIGQPEQAGLHARLDEYLRFLLDAVDEKGTWHSHYHHADGKPFGDPSPYYDGEALLALVKAAKYLDHEHLRPIIVRAAASGYRRNILLALRKDIRSRLIKGYYQWGAMAFYELATSEWPEGEQYGEIVLFLGDMNADARREAKRKNNSASIFEGILHAYDLASRQKDLARVRDYRQAIWTSFRKMLSLQVGNPLANDYVRQCDGADPLAVGGVQHRPEEPLLRIDFTQHQLHALILALRFVYRDPRRGADGGTAIAAAED